MSLPRALLTSLSALSNGLACTPPNPTRPRERYHTEEMWVLQIAPGVFKWHQIIAYTCALFEILAFLVSLLPLSPFSPALSAVTCPAVVVHSGLPLSSYVPFSLSSLSALFSSTSLSSLSSSLSTTTSTSTASTLTSTISQTTSPASIPATWLRTTPIYILGTLSVLLGTYIRLDCFSTLGEMFTFDLTVHPKHRLVTERFYSFVRHPAYTGSLMLVFGLALSHLTRGSWLAECAFPLLDAPFPFPLLSHTPSPSSPTSTPTHHIPLLGLSSHKIRLIVWALWWAWTLCVGVSRAEAEDRQMRKLFGSEWEVYRARVGWWFMPGVL